MCLSILHRHVPETEFGTGSMKYLPKYCRMLPLKHSAILLTSIKRHLVLLLKQFLPYRFYCTAYIKIKPRTLFCVLFDLIIYVPSAIFQLNKDGSSWVEPVLSSDKCVLLKDHNAVTPGRLEPAAPRSRVKHCITEPLRSQESC